MQLLIRNINVDTIKRLKKRAKQHHRSLQGELKCIVEEAAAIMTTEEMKKISLAWQKRLEGRSFSDSVDLLCEDRDR